MKATKRHVFAVIRLDLFLVNCAPSENTVTVKEIVPTQARAESEVLRLSTINKDKDCVYFWQKTKLMD